MRTHVLPHLSSPGTANQTCVPAIEKSCDVALLALVSISQTREQAPVPHFTDLAHTRWPPCHIALTSPLSISCPFCVTPPNTGTSLSVGILIVCCLTWMFPAAWVPSTESQLSVLSSLSVTA